MTRSHSFLVQIATASEATVGAGCFIGAREVITCAHVVNTALGRGMSSRDIPHDEVRVRFPLLADDAWRSARVVLWLPPAPADRPGADLAVLRIEWEVPREAAAVRIADEVPAAGRVADVFGYPGVPPRPDGGWVAATVRGSVGAGRLQLDADSSAALRVQPGYSGSPVIDRETGDMLGMLVAAPAGDSGERDSYAIAVDRMRPLLGALCRDGRQEANQRPVASLLLGRHDGAVTSVAFEATGQLVATGGADATVRLWNPVADTVVPALPHSCPVAAVAFDPDGELLAVGGHDGTVSLWNTDSRVVVGHLAHGGPVTAIAFQGDGDLLSVGGADGNVTVWKTETRMCTATLETGIPVIAVAYSIHGMLAIHGQDGIVRLAYTDNPSDEGSIRTDNLGGGVVSASPSVCRRDGSLLASGDEDGTVRLWRSGGAFDEGETVWFSVSGSEYTVALYDAHRRHTAAKNSRTEVASFRVHESAVTSLAFSAGGQLLVTGSRDGAVRVWAFEESTEEVLTRLTGHDGAVTSLAFTPEGRALATGGAEGTVRLWDVPSGVNFDIFFTELGGAVGSVAFVLGGSALLVGSPDETMRMHGLKRRSTNGFELGDEYWALAFGSTSASRGEESGNEASVTPLPGRFDGVNAVAFSPDGRTMALVIGEYVGGRDEATGQWFEFPRFADPVRSVAFSPDGTHLAIVFDNAFRLERVDQILPPSRADSFGVWGHEGGPTIAHHRRSINAAAFSPDGKTLAVGASDGTVRRWNIAARTVGTVHLAHAKAVTAVAFSPDGSALVTADEGGVAYLWRFG